ncbi:MAG: drug resistance transporter, EmrB/QacA subfamily [Actinomycetia bacterium]|nr:drug resistance transporter, EmrB/QacA subfamily [Actinomycetes bacterium]
MDTEAATSPPAGDPTRRSPRAALVAMSLANVALTVDFFGLNVLLPHVRADLGGSQSTLLWIANSYMLSLAACLLAAGRLGDIFGRKRVALVGLGLFACASVVGALSTSTGMLIAGRTLQGLGAALVTATSLSIVSDAFPDGARAAAIGIWSATGAVGSAVGPLVAGVVADVWSWRGFFVLSLPLTLVAAFLTVRGVRESRDATVSGRLDVAGLVTVTGGLVLLVYGLLEGPGAGWGRPDVVTGLVVGAALLVTFVAVERRGAAPLVDLRVFRSRAFAAAAAVGWFANFGFAAAMFYLALYLQEVQHRSSAASGVILLAFTIPLALTARLIGRLLAIGSAVRLMAVGMALLAVSFACFAALGADDGLALVLTGLVLSGLGQGLAFNVSNVAAMDACSTDKAGVASGAISAVRQLGSLFGLAVTGAVFGAASHTVAAGSSSETAFVHALRPTMLFVAVATAVGVTLPMIARTNGRAGS